LQLILDASSQPPRARSFYAALAEAAEEPQVKAALARVGIARVEYLDLCYRKIGLSAPEARARAVFAYAAYRGMLQLALIGAEGLGLIVFRGIGRLDVGLAALGGIGIVLLAIVLDRITQALGDNRARLAAAERRRALLGRLGLGSTSTSEAGEAATPREAR
jgi:hypothetical protein